MVAKKKVKKKSNKKRIKKKDTKNELIVIRNLLKIVEDNNKFHRRIIKVTYIVDLYELAI